MSRVEFGDCRTIMRAWKEQGVRVQTCVTSPPYFGLRDYGAAGQIGLEETPEQFVAELVEVFRCVRGLLADDGTAWLNLGDSYASTGGQGAQHGAGRGRGANGQVTRSARYIGGDAKAKDLIGIPWMVAFALRAGFATCTGCRVERRGDLWPVHNGRRVCIDCLMDWRHDAQVIQTEPGWYLRQEVIWAKATSGSTREGSAMPESVRDRCAKSHEQIFLLAKSPRYFFDVDAIKEPAQDWGVRDRSNMRGGTTDPKLKHHGLADCTHEKGNRRSVWRCNPTRYKGAHFATYPTALVEPCVLAGSRPGDIVLDPFIGSGTTAQVAVQLGRGYLGCELNPAFAPLISERVANASKPAAKPRKPRARVIPAPAPTNLPLALPDLFTGLDLASTLEGASV